VQIASSPPSLSLLLPLPDNSSEPEANSRSPERVHIPPFSHGLGVHGSIVVVVTVEEVEVNVVVVAVTVEVETVVVGLQLSPKYP
jgi:hypothetical protein